MVNPYATNQIVVIYFQICIFEPLETTTPSETDFTILLWFTFKFVSLNHWKQLIIIKKFLFSVVIYFQICIFEPLETTCTVYTILLHSLWFTFKFVSLNHWKQRTWLHEFQDIGCDLLSNLYLWTIGNNISKTYAYKYNVVIYFQICIFEPLETTLQPRIRRFNALWFTFKFVSLNHWKQQILDYKLSTNEL